MREKRDVCMFGFYIDEGPFCLALDTALGSFHVHHQVYYGELLMASMHISA